MTEEASTAGSPGQRRAADDAVALTSPMLKAMSHPVRRRILALMEHSPPARATDLAGPLGLPVNQVSFHLRSLARAGLVAEAPEHARDRRDRVWVPTATTFRLTGPGEPMSAEDEQVVAAFLGQTALEAQELVRRVLAWATDYASGRDRDHRGAATQETVRLTIEEMRELVTGIGDAVHAAQQRSDAAAAPDRRTWDLALFVGRDDLGRDGQVREPG
jgi:predicted ArsR family transcriptional regulator